MTKIQQEIINRIKKSGGVIVVTPYGLYTRFGQFIAFSSNPHSSKNALNTFIQKFCIPFTSSEQTKVMLQHYRNLARYKKLATKCLKASKYKQVISLAESAQFLKENLSTKNYYNNYFHLKEGL